MKFYIHISIVCLSFWLPFAFAHKGKPDPEKAALSKYTLEQLDSAAHLLVAATDQDLDKTQDLYCQISAKQAHSLLLPLHAWMDDKIDHYLHQARHLNSYAKRNWIKNCRRSCHCGLYASILEKIDDARLSSKDRKALIQLQTQAAIISSSELNRCIQRANWFCKSELLNYLKKAQSTIEIQD